ncbi:CHAT domain-containing protein [Streptomyces sp. NPDC048663]|uniref:CHAT domain-containing protein n=1 Tax=Streptomyces sp. NPDC048663 TaxID=3155638 RepID=UPI00343FBE36
MDFEVRQVKDMLCKSKYRDLVAVEHLPAATAMDLLEGLNNHRPHVVHFSGHASSLGLLMENDAGTPGGAALDFSLLARVLGAPDEPPRLVVLNACESLEGADDLRSTTFQQWLCGPLLLRYCVRAIGVDCCRTGQGGHACRLARWC